MPSGGCQCQGLSTTVYMSLANLIRKRRNRLHPRSLLLLSGRSEVRPSINKIAFIARSISLRKASKECFESIGLTDKPILLGSNFEGPPIKKQKGECPNGPYRYPRARKFCSDFQSSHSSTKITELLSVGLNLLDFGQVKIEPELSIIEKAAWRLV